MNEIYDVKVINKENNKELLFKVREKHCKYSLGFSGDVFLHNEFYLIKDDKKIQLTDEKIEDKKGKTWRGLKPSKPKFKEILEKELECEIHYIWFLQALASGYKKIEFYPSEIPKNIFKFII